MTLLLAANTFVGGAMILAIFFVDRLGPAAWLMLVAGVAMVYTSLGCLSRDVPRFKLALILALIGGAMALIAMLMTLRAARRLEADILSRPRPPGSIVVVYVESAKGRDLSTLLIAWKHCAAAAVTNLALAAYLPFRVRVVLLARHRHDA